MDFAQRCPRNVDLPWKSDHTSQRLVEHFVKMMKSFNLPYPAVTAVTHDEAANMVGVGRMLEQEIGCASEMCMAHRKIPANGVEKILSTARKLVGHFKHSAKCTEALAEKQVQLQPKCPPKKLLQDVSTRWNSIFYMLERLLQLCTALTVLMSDQELTAKKEDRDLLLKDSQWSAMDYLVSVLKP